MSLEDARQEVEAWRRYYNEERPHVIAQVIYASGEGGGYSFITGTLSGKRLESVRRDRGARFLFDWSDADSGTFAALPETNKPPYSASFSRLDG